MDELSVGPGKLRLVQGDITTIPADAIVNAANEQLVGGGGVDGAIHRRGGPRIMEDLRGRYGASRHCPTGSAVISEAGELPARWVVHAVGPIWRGGSHGEPELLGSAYDSALRLAADAGARAVTLPAISAGVYGYPLEDAARVALRTAREHLAGPDPVETVTFVLYSADTLTVFRRALAHVATST